MVPMWYQSVTNVVKCWYQSNTNLIAIWNQYRTNERMLMLKRMPSDPPPQRASLGAQMRVDAGRCGHMAAHWYRFGILLAAYWQLIGSLHRAQMPTAEQMARRAAYASWWDATFQRWQLDEIRQKCRRSTARARYIDSLSGNLREAFGKLFKTS